jgi:hypothetical protein
MSWFTQLVDSSAFEQPNAIREAIDEWVDTTVNANIVWTPDAPYPTIMSFQGNGLRPTFEALLEAVQPYLGDTEYMVFAELNGWGDSMVLYVITRSLLAVMRGTDMVRELVKQLHSAATPATGVIS